MLSNSNAQLATTVNVAGRGIHAKLALQEFDSLAEEAHIYKLVGPVLLKQEKTEAVMAVDGRLEFIENEMCVPPLLAATPILTLARKRTEKQIADLQATSDAKRMEVRSLPPATPTPQGVSPLTRTHQIINLQSQPTA